MSSTEYPNMIQAPSGIWYPEAPPPDTGERVHLVLDSTALKLEKESVDLLDSTGFAMIRRNGFGGSDSSVILGVNPFTTLPELIQQKASTTISAEEMETGNKLAVMKGNDLEPLILHKFQRAFQLRTIKPTDMYRFIDFPWLTMNFDGITGTPNQYYPVEAKVITKAGERHYNPQTVLFDSQRGFGKMPENYAALNNSIETKAAQYGIPPYYYTQLQQEILACKSQCGYLATIWEYTWSFRVYFVHRDPHVQNALIVQSSKAWDKVELLKGKETLTIGTGL